MRWCSDLFLRQHVNAARMKRMALQQPLYGKNETPIHTIARKGIIGVLRTRRIKTTSRRQHRRYQILISPYGNQKEPGKNSFEHQLAPILSKTFWRDLKACPAVKSAASFLAMMLMSQYPLILCLFSRKYSREKRLIRLRQTALPTFFVTVIPRRDLSDCADP